MHRFGVYTSSHSFADTFADLAFTAVLPEKQVGAAFSFTADVNVVAGCDVISALLRLLRKARLPALSSSSKLSLKFQSLRLLTLPHILITSTHNSHATC